MAEKVNPQKFDIYPEVIIYCKKLKLAGTIDFILVHKETGVLYLGDWKTNKKIDKKSYGGKKGIKEGTLDLDDCKLTRYAIQLTLYRYLLEENYGAKVDLQALVHLSEEKAESIRCDYLRSNLDVMLNSRRLELS